MENIIDCIFFSRDKAEDILDQVKRHAELYEKVTLADIKEIADLYSEPTDRFHWWTENMLKHAEVLRVRNGWTIKLINPIIDRASIEEIRNGSKKPHIKTPVKASIKSTPEPITITINTETVDSVEEVMADVFKYAYPITDRPVYISII